MHTKQASVTAEQPATAHDNVPDLKQILRRHKRNKEIFVLLAFFALSLNLRAPLTSLPPIIEDLKALFHISAGFAGLLTSIPVLCFGLLTPVVGSLMKNIRLESTIFLTLSGILLGTVVRSADGIQAVVAGTVITGVALTAGNIAGLMVIGREFPHRLGAMTGLYVCGMSLGAMGTMALTAPVSHALGWRLALGLPVLLVFLDLALWGAAFFYGEKEAELVREIQRPTKAPLSAASPQKTAATSPAQASVLQQPVVWILSVAFAAHTFLFYGLTAWLPGYLTQSLHMSDSKAGVCAALFQILGLLGCFGIPALAGTKKFSTRSLFLIVTVAWLVTALGLWLAPGLWPIWIVSGGIGGGGGFTVIFTLIMQRAKNLNENRIMSTVVQSVGYIVASISPIALGHLHEVSGNWHGSMALLAGTAVLMILSGLAASK
jgi:MFS transporter, CP family, cyanate transporter